MTEGLIQFSGQPHSGLSKLRGAPGGLVVSCLSVRCIITTSLVRIPERCDHAKSGKTVVTRLSTEATKLPKAWSEAPFPSIVAFAFANFCVASVIVS